MRELAVGYNVDWAVDVQFQLMGHDIDPLNRKVINLGAGQMESSMGYSISRLPLEHLVCVEAFRGYIPALLEKEVRARKKEVICAKIEELDWDSGPTQLTGTELILITDVIEHMNKDVVINLIKTWKEKAWAVAIWLPLGDTVGYISEPGGVRNELQRHVSVWEGEELEELGFNVDKYMFFHQHVRDNKTKDFIHAAWCFWVKEKTPFVPTPVEYVAHWNGGIGYRPIAESEGKR